MPRWLTLAQARAYSGLSHNTLRALADDGTLRTYRTPGGHRRWCRDALDDYTNRHEVDTLAIKRAVGL